jgi:hypothetical protein
MKSRLEIRKQKKQRHLLYIEQCEEDDCKVLLRPDDPYFESSTVKISICLLPSNPPPWHSLAHLSIQRLAPRVLSLSLRDYIYTFFFL